MSVSNSSLVYTMTYVRKTLADMLEDIGLGRDSNPTIEDTFTTIAGAGVESVSHYEHNYYKHHLKNHVPSDDYFWELFNGGGGVGSVVGHLIMNSYSYGYERQGGGKVMVRYFFGQSGVVIQVQDFGHGFNADREMELLMDEGRLREREPRHRGRGLGFFRGKKYEANIVSSQIEPTGTTATIMYKYAKLNPS